MKTVILNTSTDGQYSDKVDELEQCFKERKLIDKTVCENKIVYIFSEPNIHI